MTVLGPPSFWYSPAGMRARALEPVSRITAKIAQRRLSRAPFVCGVPVLCCGNVTVGGTGKTIAALDFARRLILRGRTPHFLSRGYGGRLAGPIRVDPAIHDADAVGDEPLLLAAVAPTWIGANRAETARRAIASGADCLVMDDGLQNHTLEQTFRLIVVDGAMGFGNGRLLPAGPLREPLDDALLRADAALVIGTERSPIVWPPGLWRTQAWIEPDLSLRRLAGKRVTAFAGIGRPAKFFSSLIEAGITPVRCLSFPDHHRYRAKDVSRLLALAERGDTFLATTEKDAVKLPEELRDRAFVVRVGLRWADRRAPEAILDRLLATS
ncbi:tetraacyldisaccharide 4'-kinase [Tanticharoenia sakaeratensis]|uniref:Tetraacyldisaccharide 4'-kinase n=1 Tax=Tanticharoenia sakaeratensis NBRC 103193 TaxID=1231623 RepID=A0A0D6MJ23_9PROT|nr:tetraacyldisaccharide 4'-kinase [Tanticharoenia sakaeratensis]GAN53253.1 tetraacyldisaccharide 4'-kinase [Tanticharoenia sakaeratensis NBRC 103193]GBQ21179.1 tetraacyldisaccharide 4'-kinase [Tanticharoenia sakaeratensis NBRC 103193]